MANVVELREVGDEKLEEMLENAREEMFNLRFQQAATRLPNFARLRQVRREIAQFETVLHMRRMAVEAAAGQPEIAKVLEGKEWKGTARFSYEDNGWLVTLVDNDDRRLATATVDLNRKNPKGRKARAEGKSRQTVTSYEVG
jgi:large subunit ribosomal protein L29